MSTVYFQCKLKYSYCFGTQNTPSLDWSLFLEYIFPCELPAARRCSFTSVNVSWTCSTATMSATSEEEAQRAESNLVLRTTGSSSIGALIACTPHQQCPDLLETAHQWGRLCLCISAYFTEKKNTGVLSPFTRRLQRDALCVMDTVAGKTCSKARYSC